MMPSERTWQWAGVALLLAVEIWLFTGSFGKFFNHDSLFYVLYAPRSAAEAAGAFLAPDEARQYRPLTLAVMGPVVSRFGPDPRPYHWIPVGLHLVNTVLFYLLARRLLPGSIAVLAATGFWGLHSVAGWITYDITYLSDLMMVFFGLLSLLLALKGTERNSRPLLAGSVLLFACALLSKEAATTLPLALAVSLVLFHIRDRAGEIDAGALREAVRRAMPLTALFLAVAVLYAGLLGYWFQSGLLYAQGDTSAYDIDPLTNLGGKTTYLYWAVNLPDALQIPSGTKYRIASLLAMGAVLLAWLLHLVRVRFRLHPAEWGGLLWLAGMSVPALLLSQRLAKWYLYAPVLGLALALGYAARGLHLSVPARIRPFAGIPILILLVSAVAFSSRAQTRSFLASSDSAYVSEVYRNCLDEFGERLTDLPRQATLYMLPSFEQDVSIILSSPPVERGQLLELYFPGSRIETLFAYKGEPLPGDFPERADIRIIQYLDGRFHDVTRYFRPDGRMKMFLLPTFEGEVPPLLQKEPIGGRELFARYVEMRFADEGARLPEDYATREDVWILQYMNGNFTDVTDYYKGRRRDSSLRLLQRLDRVSASVNRNEYYPDYERFATPGGGPVFHPTPGTEIVTQIGGSDVVVPLPRFEAGSSLRFGASWMFGGGDGGWAELQLRRAAEPDRRWSLFREYMGSNGSDKGLVWKEVELNLTPYAGQDLEMVLRCFNDPGKNTISDWLNWRDIALQSPASKPRQ